MSIVSVASAPVQIVQQPQPVQALAAARAVTTGPSTQNAANLTQKAAPTYQVLQGGATFPPSSSPAFVLPANSRGFIQLYDALQAIAVEHVYPAPIFSFSA